MTITEISRAEWDLVTKGRRLGRTPSEESRAVLSLKVDAALKIPCRWHHSGNHLRCNGSTIVRAAANRYGMKVITHHELGYLYVLRLS